MGRELRLAVLGDSLAAGTGASRPQDGLGPLVARASSARGGAVTARVLAVPGAVSSALPPQVAQALAWRCDVALVVVGGNDLIRLVPEAESVRHLRRAVSDLRASGAGVVVVPVPDLSVVAHVPPEFREVVRLGSERLRRAQTQAAVTVGGRVVNPSPATTAAFAEDPALFSADRFHPSSAGYAVLAADLAPAVAAAVRDAGGDEEGAGGDA